MIHDGRYFDLRAYCRWLRREPAFVNAMIELGRVAGEREAAALLIESFLCQTDQGKIEAEDGEPDGSGMLPSEMIQNIMDNENRPEVVEAIATKSKKTRTVDYARTDKKPHSFRYKRGSAFAPRAGAVALSKEPDGALVIGPLPNGVEAQADAAKLESGQLKLVSVKKRPNGKTAITFESEMGPIVCYDARSARASLRSA